MKVEKKHMYVFLNKLYKQLGLPYEAEAILATDVSIMDEALTGLLGIKVTVRKESEDNLDFIKPEELIPGKIKEILKKFPNSIIGMDFKYNNETLCLNVDSDGIGIGSGIESVPPNLKKYVKEE